MADMDRMDAILHTVGRQARADLPLDEWKQAILESARRSQRRRRMRSAMACAATFVVLLGGVGLFLHINGVGKANETAVMDTYSTVATADAAIAQDDALAYDGDTAADMPAEAAVFNAAAPTVTTEETLAETADTSPLPSPKPKMELYSMTAEAPAAGSTGAAPIQDTASEQERCSLPPRHATGGDGLTISLASDQARKQAQSVIEYNWPASTTLSVSLRSDERYLAVVDPGESEDGLLFVFLNEDMEIAE